MSSRLRIVGLIVAVGFGLSFVEAAGFFARSALQGHPIQGWLALRTGLGLWMTMAAVTPLPIVAARRFPLVRGRVAARLPVHLLAALLFVTLHLMLDIGVQTLQGNMRPEPLLPHLGDLLGNYLATESVIYAAVAGAFMFTASRSESEARARAEGLLRAQLSEARLEALRLQLAPHFLYNTLNAISTLILRGSARESCRAIALLADMLRRVLESPTTPETRLSDELAFAGLFVEIQKLRFGDALSVEWNVTADAAEAQVPRLLLQPLLENAIAHGLRAETGGAISLAARRDADSLLIEVEDRPHGERPEPATSDGPAHLGIGLANARERLATLYGSAQSLTLDVSPTGARVALRMPFRVGAERGGS